MTRCDKEGFDSHTFGYFCSFFDARKVVAKNHFDLHEGLFEYIVIEGVKPGIPAEIVSEDWYRWDGERWQIDSKPSWAKNVCNFGIG